MSDETPTNPNSNPTADPHEPSLADLISKLNTLQQSTFQFLTTGLKPIHAARAAGISDRTIYRWLNHDVRFIAAFNAWRAQIFELSRARALGMSGLALDTLHSALQAGDRRVAFKLAQSLGLFKQKRPGPQTPAGVARSRARSDLAKRIKLAQRARNLKDAASGPELRSSHTVYDIDDRIWLLMLERKRALKQEPPHIRHERQESQAFEREDDEELEKIHRAIRDATE